VNEQLVLLARERIADNSLPRTGKFRTFGGPGSGKPCALCREIIPSDLVEIIVESDDGHAEFIFHARCHAAWLVAFGGATVELP
jgi:hypothetical protein